MTKDQQKWWERAYSTAHVLADITEKAIGPKQKLDPEWLLEEAKKLHCIAQAIASRSRGEKVETISP